MTLNDHNCVHVPLNPNLVCVGCQERLSVEHILIHCVEYIDIRHLYSYLSGRRRSPAVACWASDHWVASSNPLRGKFRH